MTKPKKVKVTAKYAAEAYEVGRQVAQAKYQKREPTKSLSGGYRKGFAEMESEGKAGMIAIMQWAIDNQQQLNGKARRK